MKKVIAVFLVVLFLFSSCNSNPTPTTSSNDTVSIAEENQNFTRAEAITSLYEISDKQNISTTPHPFSDVSTKDSYNLAVQWAFDEELITGNEFRPNDSITAEEFAQFIFDFMVKFKNVTAHFYKTATEYCAEKGILTQSTQTFSKEEGLQVMENLKNHIADKENINYEDYQNIEFDENNVVLSFAIMSDIHIASDTDTAAADKYKKAVDLAVKYSNNDLDLVMIAGDLVQNLMYDDKAETAIKEIDAFKMFTDQIIPKGVGLLFCTGNHDRSSKNGYEENFSAAFRSTQADIDRYYSYDVVEDCDYSKGLRHAVVNGYHFLSVGMHQNYVSYLKPILEKLTAEDPLKPIFVQYHFPSEDTVFETKYSDTTKQPAMRELLSGYPQVVFFSGHTHSPIENPRAIWQGDYTALDTASVRELWDEGLINGFLKIPVNATHAETRIYAGESTLVQVDKNNNIRFVSYNLYRGDIVAERVIAAPNKDKTHLLTYTDNRKDASKAPVFTNGANLTLKKTMDDNILVSFNAATHEEIVWYYSLTFSAENKEDQVFYFSSGFYKENGMPKVIEDTIYHEDNIQSNDNHKGLGNTLEKGVTYKATLIAYDAWENASEPQVVTYTHK